MSYQPFFAGNPRGESESARDFLARRQAELAEIRIQFEEASSRIEAEIRDSIFWLRPLRRFAADQDLERNSLLVQDFSRIEAGLMPVIEILGLPSWRQSVPLLKSVIIGIASDISWLRNPSNGQGDRKAKSLHYEEADWLQEIHDDLSATLDELEALSAVMAS